MYKENIHFNFKKNKAIKQKVGKVFMDTSQKEIYKWPINF